MAGIWLTLFLTLPIFHLSVTFILPLKTANGSLDVEHLVGRITFIEQTITGFQQTIKSQDEDIVALQTEITNLKASQQVISRHATDITSLKTEVSTMKANQQIITNHGTDIAALKTEISNLKATSYHSDIVAIKTEVASLKTNQQKFDIRISDLQKQFKASHISAEVTSLKDEINAAKTEVTWVSNEVISLTSKFNNLTLSWQMISDQNMTGTVHAINDTLARVIGRVQSADNDRILLHGSVNNLNKTVSTLSNNLAVNTTVLSAEIALLKTEVGFNIWLGPNVNLQASSWTTLKFKDIKYNRDDGYNTTTGVFTASVSGTYLFWTQVRKTSGSYLDLYLKKRNSFISGFYSSTAGHVEGSVITTTAVTVGEQVYVNIEGADSVDCCYESRFGGALLYRH